MTKRQDDNNGDRYTFFLQTISLLDQLSVYLVSIPQSPVLLMQAKRKVLLVDLDDSRRETRVALLTRAGYEVDVRADHIDAEHLGHESGFDLIIVALHHHPEEAAAYTDRLTRKSPTLPILLLTDHGVYVPRGTLSQSIAGGDPAALLLRVAEMLTGSRQVKELPIDRPSTQL